VKEMIELLGFVVSELEKRNIRYALTGSMALYAYTMPRFTRDIDIVIDLELTDFDSFASIFTDRNCYFHHESAKVEVERGGMFNIIDWTYGFKIDFIVKKVNPFQESEFARRERKAISDNLSCYVISAEDLVIAKLIWIQELFSEQQTIDISNLLTQQPTIDRVYIRDWVDKLNLNDFGLLNND
jgi:hypothetical protein